MPRPDESCAPGPHPVPDGDSTASETLPVARAASEDAVQSSLELRVRYVDRPREVVPLHRATVEHVIDGVHLRFHPEPGRARFRCLTSSAQVYKNGEAVDAGTLEAGASIEVGRHRVFLWDAGNPIAYLRGYSTPCANEIWPLPPGLHPIGRAGDGRMPSSSTIPPSRASTPPSPPTQTVATRSPVNRPPTPCSCTASA